MTSQTAYPAAYPAPPVRMPPGGPDGVMASHTGGRDRPKAARAAP